MSELHGAPLENATLSLEQSSLHMGDSRMYARGNTMFAAMRLLAKRDQAEDLLRHATIHLPELVGVLLPG